ncbi:hypothetical protein [Pendulispora albinea]|uniref:Uncharacterized protein n=1 Tax=Pendulispora albinea TaxID=2741071 RepID=A0ABZ2M9F2_9BACT
MATLGVAAAAILAGCPVYDGDNGHRVCEFGKGSQSCYDCPNPYYTDECVPYQCGSNYDCPSGYSCQANLCVSGGPGNCNKPSDCPSGQSCGKDNQCRPGDCTRNGCPNGGTCRLSGGKPECVSLDGGSPIDAGPAPDASVPDAGPPPQCTRDGEQDTCLAGSICLHHNCYLNCSPSDPKACKGADRYNICKAVTATTGTYNVCSATSNPGTECDTTKPCLSPNVCIDGYCK